MVALLAGLAAPLLSLLVASILPRAHSANDGWLVPLLLAALILLLSSSAMLILSDVARSNVIVTMIYATAVLPFSIWHLRSGLDCIPRELERSARIDGFSTGQFLRRVILPSIALNLGATAAFSLATAWAMWLVFPSLFEISGPLALAHDPIISGSNAVLIAIAPLLILFLLLGVCFVRNATGRTGQS